MLIALVAFTLIWNKLAQLILVVVRLRKYKLLECVCNSHIIFVAVQTSYIRPLSEIIHVNVPKEKISKEQENIVVKLKIDSQRPRFKSKSLNVRTDLSTQKFGCLIAKLLQNGEGGCTITHNEKGDIINTTVINEDPVPQKVRAYVKKPVIKLVYCRPFTDQNPVYFFAFFLLAMNFSLHTLSRVLPDFGPGELKFL